MTKQSIRWMAVAAGLAVFVTGADAQRAQVGRPGMTATGSIVEGAERSSGVSGPTLGYVWDASTANIHMVTGIAGSSLAGSPVHRGAPVTLAAISPARDYAVVVDESGAVSFYGELTARAGRGVALWNDSSRVSHAAVSPGGDRIALLSAESGRVSLYAVVDGAPGDPVVFSAALPSGELRRLAVADTGNAVFALMQGGSGSSVSRIATDGSVRAVAALPGIADLALFAGSERALLLDASQNALYEADLAEASPTLNLVASQADGIEEPSAIALSGDDRSVAIASSTLRRAVVIDLVTRSSRQLELPESPTGIRRLNARGVFQLTDANKGPMLLLEVQQEGARTVYVPRPETARSADSARAGLR